MATTTATTTITRERKKRFGKCESRFMKLFHCIESIYMGQNKYETVVVHFSLFHRRENWLWLFWNLGSESILKFWHWLGSSKIRTVRTDIQIELCETRQWLCWVLNSQVERNLQFVWKKKINHTAYKRTLTHRGMYRRRRRMNEWNIFINFKLLITNLGL